MSLAVLSTTYSNGRKYTVVRHKYRGIFLYLDDKKQYTQSIGGIGQTNAYYDEIATYLLKISGTVLLLGTAGGTIARRTHEMGGQAQFYGVDNDIEMIRLGRLFFNLDKYVKKVFLVDAREFCRNHGGGSFDAVVHDLYIDSTTRIQLDGRRLVKRGGLYIENHLRKGLLVETI